MGKGFCDVGCDCLSCVNESLRSRVRELEEQVREYHGAWKRIMDEKCAPDEVHCSCVPALKLRIREFEETVEGLVNGNHVLNAVNTRLGVENIAMANAIGNLRALLPDYDDNGVIKKISELERLRDYITHIEGCSICNVRYEFWCDGGNMLRRRAGMEVSDG